MARPPAQRRRSMLLQYSGFATEDELGESLRVPPCGRHYWDWAERCATYASMRAIVSARRGLCSRAVRSLTSRQASLSVGSCAMRWRARFRASSLRLSASTSERLHRLN